MARIPTEFFFNYAIDPISFTSNLKNKASLILPLYFIKNQQGAAFAHNIKGY